MVDGGTDVTREAVPVRTTTLRYGPAWRAGLVGGQLERLVDDAAAFLGPSPDRPWYAGAVLLAGRGGTIALHRAIGHAVRYAAYDERTGAGVELPAGRRVAMARDTVFDLASLSKLFTSVLAVRRIERGELALEAAVASYLPEFGVAGKGDITVRGLLTHTSGLRAWLPFHGEATRAGRLRMLWDEAPVHTPGTVLLYSDLNMIALQLLLERITDRTLETLLHDEITAPLGMRRTRYRPPVSWWPDIAATEDARPPWSGLDRGMVRGEVHDENAYAFGGVAGHAGVFSTAHDLAVLARTLLNGGAYGTARILRPESVELMFTDFNGAFPGEAHGLGFELGRRWYMGAMTTPRTVGHTGFTGTSVVLDPTTDSFLIVLGNSVHPVRSWRSGSAPRVACADRMARAVAVRPEHGATAWFAGTARDTTATLTLPDLEQGPGRGRLGCALWWDTVPGADTLVLEASADAGLSWRPVPFSTVRPGQPPLDHPAGAVSGWSGRVWHRLTAELPGTPAALRLRWRCVTRGPYTGRGVYVTGLRIESTGIETTGDGDGTDGRTVFDESRPEDAARIEAAGWTASAD